MTIDARSTLLALNPVLRAYQIPTLMQPQCEIDERVDDFVRGCRKCGKETRAYTTFMGEDFCDSCIGIVIPLNAVTRRTNWGQH